MERTSGIVGRQEKEGREEKNRREGGRKGDAEIIRRDRDRILLSTPFGEVRGLL